MAWEQESRLGIVGIQGYDEGPPRATCAIIRLNKRENTQTLLTCSTCQVRRSTVQYLWVRRCERLAGGAARQQDWESFGRQRAFKIHL